MVSLVQPGLIDTDLNAHHREDAGQVRSLFPLGRYGTSQEVATVVAFLAGLGSAFMTGSIVTVDGGLNTQEVPN